MIKKFMATYSESWFLPAGVSLIVGFVFVFSSQRHWHRLGDVLLYLLLASVIGIVAAAIICFVRKRWFQGVLQLLVVIPAVIVALFVISFIGAASGDGFADHLTIPKNINVTEPLEWHGNLQVQSFSGKTANSEDRFQAQLMHALETKGTDDATVTANIPSLISLYEHHPKVLERYLACSPCWRLFEERGSKFATRRWIAGPHWHYELHGYYSSDKFQTRATIGLSGRSWAGISDDSTQMKPGETKKLILSGYNRPRDSQCIISKGDLVLEVFEQSDVAERRLTKATLAYLEDEFSKINASPHWSTILSLLPNGLTKPDKPEIKLWDGGQPGVYESEIWANPGESGKVYLKAYEVTKNTRLSESELNKHSNEWIGWSDDPKQLFLSNTFFFIDEGDWGKPYAARFEVWFVPDSGAPERKLMQKVFKIEGWQR